MKLDKINFAKLISFISYRCDLTTIDIQSIDDLIDITVPNADKVPASMVDELIMQIANPDGFISAIKAYRALTGATLKESKDVIEKYRVIPNFKHSEPKEANLGDILHSAGRTKAGNNIG